MAETLDAEVGQFIFVAAVLLVWAVLVRLPIRWPKYARYVPAYVIGSLAIFWFFERIWNAFFRFTV